MTPAIDARAALRQQGGQRGERTGEPTDGLAVETHGALSRLHVRLRPARHHARHGSLHAAGAAAPAAAHLGLARRTAGASASWGAQQAAISERRVRRGGREGERCGRAVLASSGGGRRPADRGRGHRRRIVALASGIGRRPMVPCPCSQMPCLPPVEMLAITRRAGGVTQRERSGGCWTGTGTHKADYHAG